VSTNPTALVFLDTETLGLGIDDPIWEIAAIRREPDGTEVCALLADVQAIAAAETTAAPGPHSDTPATVEAVSVAHSDGE
jgi:hypothetical protein